MVQVERWNKKLSLARERYVFGICRFNMFQLDYAFTKANHHTRTVFSSVEMVRHHCFRPCFAALGYTCHEPLMAML